MSRLYPLLTPKLLQKYFPVVKDLRSYLAEILDIQPNDEPHFSLLSDTDTPIYRDLVNTTYVALQLSAVQPRFRVFPPMTDMREVCLAHVLCSGLTNTWIKIIDRSQERIFRNKGRSQNVLTLGYRVRFILHVCIPFHVIHSSI